MIKVIANKKNADIEICGMFERDKEIVKHLFYGKEGEVCIFPSQGSLICFLGLGKEEEFTANKVRNLYAKAIKEIKKHTIRIIQINEIQTEKIDKRSMLKAILEGIYLADYEYKGYRTKQKEDVERELILNGFDQIKEKEQLIEHIYNLTDSINEARDMIQEPANCLYPEALAERAKKIAQESGFEIEVLEEDAIQELGMNAFLAVGKGALHRPKLLVMRYYNSNGPVLGLVGKGITFDTGGYCLKSPASMSTMKEDMAGAASVIAIMSALAKNRCTVNIIAVAACCENIISGESYKPGDVITAMSKKTIEVQNTDAEGRLTLADALNYIIEVEKADQVIDLATLTGLAERTFGSLYTPVFTNDDTFLQQFMEAAKEAGEDYWKMPCDSRYHSYIESKIADIKNTGKAGSITAAMFLNDFVGEIPWIHLDIAGTAQQEPVVFEYAKDCPSGVAIRTIYEMVQQEPATVL